MNRFKHLALILILGVLLAACSTQDSPIVPENNLTNVGGETFEPMRFYTAQPSLQSHMAVEWPSTINGVDLAGTTVDILGTGLGSGTGASLPGSVTVTNLGNVRGIYVQVVLKAGTSPNTVSVTTPNTTKAWPSGAGGNLTLIPIETPDGKFLTDGSYEGFFSRAEIADMGATDAVIEADVAGAGTSPNLTPRAFVVYVFRDSSSSTSVGRTPNLYIFGSETQGVLNNVSGTIPAYPKATQKLTIPSSSSARNVDVTFVISDVESGPAASDGANRIIVLEAEANGIFTYGIFDKPNKDDELLIATLTLPNVPGSVTEVTANVISPERTHPYPEDPQKRRGDSVFWNGINATVAVKPPPPPPPAGGEGCTPGFWRNWTGMGPGRQGNAWERTGYSPNQLFSDVFENAFPGKTLLQVVSQGGGGLDALGRHTVAALLNAAHPDVSYDLTVEQVISKFNAVFPGNNRAYNTLKDEFEAFNEQGCPLNRNNF